MNIPSMPQTTMNQNLENKKSTSSLEEALIASEIRYRRLFESAKDGILILDAETGMIIDVNPFLIKLLGYSKESFIEKTIWEIGFLKDIIDNKDKFLELQLDKYVRYEDLPLETATGRKINVEFVSNIYAEGRKKVIQCNIRDITDRKRTEEVLRQKTALLEAQINSSIDGIIIVDNQGKKILQNQRAIDLWKIPQHIADDEDDSLQVQHVKTMTKNPEKLVKKIKELYEHPDISRSDDVELVDGTVLERYSAPVIDKEGRNFGRIWIFHDITERKRDELELIKAKEEAKAAEIQLGIGTI
jgi:PAS domain S-box-containing protein